MAQLNTALVAVMLIGSLAKVLLVLDAETVAEAQAAFLPVEATAYVKANALTGPMFNSYNWGGYLIFNLPDEPVFVDGRTDLYGDAFLQTYLNTAVGGEGWRDTLDEYDIQLVFVEAQSGLARQLRGEPGWMLAHEDNLAVVFAREVADA
jgi:hypothetical protein